jgi:hypothetical protein
MEVGVKTPPPKRAAYFEMLLIVAYFNSGKYSRESLMKTGHFISERLLFSQEIL